MLPIAGQTAEPNGLNCLFTLMEAGGVSQAKKFEMFFFSNFFNFFNGQRRALQLVSYKTVK